MHPPDTAEPSAAESRPAVPNPAAAVVSNLFSTRTTAAYVSVTRRAAQFVAERADRIEGPRSRATVDELRRAVDGIDLDRPLGGTEQALHEVGELWLDHAVWFHHPMSMAHLNCRVALPALAAEAMISALNTSMDTWDQSTVATLIEQRLVEWTAQQIGFGPGAGGTFTSGGTQSNLHGLLLAREDATLRHGRHRPLRFVASDQAHFSVAKSARLLGLGPDGLLLCPTGTDRRIDPDALDAVLTAAQEKGEVVAAVVATAGTTDLGAIDPLPRIAEICARHGVWLHVDAAYGCGLLVSPTRRSWLRGIERADSVTVDFHKSFFQPVSCSALIVRSAASFDPVAVHADYLNPRESTEPNLVDLSLQTTRRFDALKLWTTLRALGADALGEAFDDLLDLARTAHGIASRAADLEVAADPVLSTVLFRYHPEGIALRDAEQLVRQIRDALFAEGAVLLAQTRLDGSPWLKITLLDPAITATDLESMFHAVGRVGAALVEADSLADVLADAVLRDAFAEVSGR